MRCWRAKGDALNSHRVCAGRTNESSWRSRIAISAIFFGQLGADRVALRASRSGTCRRLIRAAFAAGLHVIVEKPWIYSREETTLVAGRCDQSRVKGRRSFRVLPVIGD